MIQYSKFNSSVIYAFIADHALLATHYSAFNPFHWSFVNPEYRGLRPVSYMPSTPRYVKIFPRKVADPHSAGVMSQPDQILPYKHPVR